jgi:hypothetical protein
MPANRPGSYAENSSQESHILLFYSPFSSLNGKRPANASCMIKPDATYAIATP